MQVRIDIPDFRASNIDNKYVYTSHIFSKFSQGMKSGHFKISFLPLKLFKYQEASILRDSLYTGQILAVDLRDEFIDQTLSIRFLIL